MIWKDRGLDDEGEHHHWLHLHGRHIACISGPGRDDGRWWVSVDRDGLHVTGFVASEAQARVAAELLYERIGGLGRVVGTRDPSHPDEAPE